jgi:cobalt/nickel transport system ATP-binding protein
VSGAWFSGEHNDHVSQPLFCLASIHFAYDAARPVLRGVDLSLHAGERLAVRGPNGAGKTSLLLLMVGLLRAQAGRIEAFGSVRRHERDFHEVRRRAGLLFQDADDQLFCPTVIEDVIFGPLNLGRTRAQAGAIAERTLAALGLAGMEERITHRLSGGEKRLVSLASVLAMEPDVLLLDEPTSGLDEAATERLIEALLALDQAMVIVSHDSAFRARLATRHARLQCGVLLAGAG